MNDHETGVKQLERLLRDRVLDVRPDLEARAADGIRAGSRLRRRRRVWGVLAASAAVVAVVGVGTQLDVSLGSVSHTPGVATDPGSASPSGGTPTGCPRGATSGWIGATVPPPSPGAATRAEKERLARQYARLASSAHLSAACKKSLSTAPRSPGSGSAEQLPVSLVAPGWTCTAPGDEKFICTAGAASVVVTVRPANEHDAYLHDPDKASPDQYVSDIHGKVFATIERTPNEPTVDVTDLGHHLVWS